MARQAGPQFLIGKIGNLIYYKRGGEYFVRASSAPTREQLKKGKNYKKLRESNVEFSGGAVIGKAFRDIFSSLIEFYTTIHTMSPTSNTIDESGLRMRLPLRSIGRRFIGGQYRWDSSSLQSLGL